MSLLIRGRKETNIYREGKKIYGDDFTLDEIESWFTDEENGYAEIVPDGDKENYSQYENVTNYMLYRYLKGKALNVLSYGGGYGTEVLPIIERISKLTVLEPGEKFQTNEIAGKKVHYVKPTISGEMVFEDNSFDCITCLDVLHHVPNVSYILTEFFRVVKPGGVVLIREPITSMRVFDSIGRKGATKRERGIPLLPFRDAIKEAGFRIQRETLYGFGPLFKLKQLMGGEYSNLYIRADILLSKLFRWNYSYDNKNLWKKFRPTQVAYVIKR